MQPNLEIEDLHCQHAVLKGGRFRIQSRENKKEIRDLGREIRNKKGSRAKNVKAKYRKYYFHNRPTQNIKRQFSGEAEEEEAEVEFVAPAIELYIPERAELAEILVNQPEDLGNKGLLQLRIRSIKLIIALNNKRETAKRRRALQKVQPNIDKESYYVDPFPIL